MTTTALTGLSVSWRNIAITLTTPHTPSALLSRAGPPALVFVLHHSLNQTEWLVLMLLAIVGLCGTAIAAWTRSLWWLFGTIFSLVLIIGLVGAVAG
jgi:hypothetical protein